MTYNYDRRITASEAYLGRARARAYKAVNNFEKIIEAGDKPRVGGEHRIAIYQYLLATEQVKDLDFDGLPIHVGGGSKEIPRLLKVLHYSATEQTNDPSGVWLDSLDEAWMGPESEEEGL